MTAIVHAALVYGALLIIFRLLGKRGISELTTFDFILLLIISEATQEALVGQDYSITQALLVILTLVLIDLGLNYVKSASPSLDRILEGAPLVVVELGKPLKERLRKSRLEESDVLEAARSTRGLERMDQVKYAVLEKTGAISIIPFER